MHRLATYCAAFIVSAFVFAVGPVLAEDVIPPSPIVKTTLTVDAAAPQKGEVVWAGVTFTIPQHWHIYWQNPGDSGLSTEYTWTVPKGFKAGEVLWPTPERLETSSLVNYGYSNRVTLPVPFTVTRDGAQGYLEVTAKWLVCKDVCVPESATLHAALPTKTADAALLQQARNAAPRETMRATYAAHDGVVTLQLPWLDKAHVSDVHFFPIEDGIITNTAPQKAVFNAQQKQLILVMKHGGTAAIAEWHGVLRLKQDGAVRAVSVIATNLRAAEVAKPTPPPAPSVSLLSALVLAFLGGLILNIMPCVLPILALKALAIAKKADASRRIAAQQGFAYTAGVVLSFLIIAAAMLALKATGAAIGWGFQLQSPTFVAVLALVMALVAANLLGLFELPVLFGEKATRVNDSSLRGSFLTGALAVLVATPCTAPFMATAIGATLTFSPAAALLVFAVLGLGMAAPFLLISLWPAARRLLPKPGMWMQRFKQLLAIPMLATAVWLVWVFVQLQSPTHSEPMAGHEAYSAEKLVKLREARTPVLVDATADWCLTCKINERVALSSPSMQVFLRDKKVVLMVADWTNSDPKITQYLSDFGRGGVPLYVYYPPGKEPVVLPQLLTPTIVRKAITHEAY